MNKKKKRPVYLNLFKIKLPVGGIVSITHRVTGLLLAFMMPVALYLLDLSLSNEDGFRSVSDLLTTPAGKAGVYVVLWMTAQHFYSGLRHLLMDLDIGAKMGAARVSAWLTYAASLSTVIIVGAIS